MIYNYRTLEFDALHKLERERKKGRLSGRDEGRAKRIHALVLQSVNRHGVNVPKEVVYGEVAASIVGLRYGNPLIAILLPMIAAFVQQMAPVLIAFVVDWIKSLNPDSNNPVQNVNTYRLSTLSLLAEEASAKWKL